jgi:hypothetical protein
VAALQGMTQTHTSHYLTQHSYASFLLLFAVMSSHSVIFRLSRGLSDLKLIAQAACLQFCTKCVCFDGSLKDCVLLLLLLSKHVVTDTSFD